MAERCYLEITNVCNLKCRFCPGHDRAGRFMSFPEFDALTDRLRGQVKFLYFHLMGEPTLHPQLPQFIGVAREKGFVPVLTTNGTRLSAGLAQETAGRGLYKANISLHSLEGNGLTEMEVYVRGVMAFSLEASSSGVIVVLRLWNRGGYNTENEAILNLVAQSVPRPWTERADGWRLAQNLFIEYDSMFSWPDSDGDECGDSGVFCHALRNQIGVLADGRVVPCCLDHDGDMALGSLFDNTLEEILASDRARAIYDGFSRHEAVEPLCRTCGYANVTKRFRR